MIEVHLLGTASCFPTPARGVSCTTLRHDEGVWLFDCGEGSQIQLQKSEIKPGRINKIFITHLHGDHLFGLPGLMCTIGQNNTADDKVIDVYGPKGLRNFLRMSLGISKSFLGYQFRVHEILIANTEGEGCLENISTEFHVNELEGSLITQNDDKSFDVCKSKNLSVSAHPLEHTVPCVGFVIKENDLPGQLDARLLKSSGVPPGPLYGRIKQGETILLDNGLEIKPEDVMGPSRKGRIIVILGDTSNSDSVLPFANGADVVLHEATYEDEMQDLAMNRGHSTAGMAGRFGNKVGAKRLVMTHFSQRYRPMNDELKKGEESLDKLVKQAGENFNGEIVAANDFTVIKLPLPR
eukprot:gene20256-22240_t